MELLATSQTNVIWQEGDCGDAASSIAMGSKFVEQNKKPYRPRPNGTSKSISALPSSDGPDGSPNRSATAKAGHDDQATQRPTPPASARLIIITKPSVTLPSATRIGPTRLSNVAWPRLPNTHTTQCPKLPEPRQNGSPRNTAPCQVTHARTKKTGSPGPEKPIAKNRGSQHQKTMIGGQKLIQPSATAGLRAPRPAKASAVQPDPLQAAARSRQPATGENRTW